jgi:hypothetical protein
MKIGNIFSIAGMKSDRCSELRETTDPTLAEPRYQCVVEYARQQIGRARIIDDRLRHPLAIDGKVVSRLGAWTDTDQAPQHAREVFATVQCAHNMMLTAPPPRVATVIERAASTARAVMQLHSIVATKKAAASHTVGETLLKTHECIRLASAVAARMVEDRQVSSYDMLVVNDVVQVSSDDEDDDKALTNEAQRMVDGPGCHAPKRNEQRYRGRYKHDGQLELGDEVHPLHHVAENVVALGVASPLRAWTQHSGVFVVIQKMSKSVYGREDRTKQKGNKNKNWGVSQLLHYALAGNGRL